MNPATYLGGFGCECCGGGEPTDDSCKNCDGWTDGEAICIHVFNYFSSTSDGMGGCTPFDDGPYEYYLDGTATALAGVLVSGSGSYNDGGNVVVASFGCTATVYDPDAAEYDDRLAWTLNFDYGTCGGGGETVFRWPLPYRCEPFQMGATGVTFTASGLSCDCRVQFDVEVTRGACSPAPAPPPGPFAGAAVLGDDQLPPLSRAEIRARLAALKQCGPCAHLGDPIPGRPCGSQLRACALHGVCTVLSPCQEASACCAVCPDHTGRV